MVISTKAEQKHILWHRDYTPSYIPTIDAFFMITKKHVLENT